MDDKDIVTYTIELSDFTPMEDAVNYEPKFFQCDKGLEKQPIHGDPAKEFE